MCSVGVGVGVGKGEEDKSEYFNSSSAGVVLSCSSVYFRVEFDSFGAINSRLKEQILILRVPLYWSTLMLLCVLTL